MKTLSIIVFQVLIFSAAFSQNNVERVLAEVEKNNTGLAALQMHLDAQGIANKTGIYLHHPEFEYAWFSGSPDGIGNKTNISLRQQFDFPTAYLHKTRIANARNEQLLQEYEKQRRELLLETRMICLELIHINARAQELRKRLQHAQRLANAYEAMLEAGETNIIEHNKAQLNFLDQKKQAERNDIRQQALLNQLAGLNGGIQIQFADASFYPVLIDEDFERWYVKAEERNPVLKWLSQENQDVSLLVFSRSENLFPDQKNVNWQQFNIIEDEFNPEIIPASVDALVYFPGTINLKPFQTLKTEDFKNDLEINFFGAVKAVKAFYRPLRKSGNGSVVLFSTVAAKVGMPYHASIASAKAAVEGLTRSLAAEFAPHIRVNCIAPSLTETQMASKLLSNKERRNSIAQRNPMKKIGQPRELAKLVEFLAGEKSSWITGQIIGIDGGMSTLNLS